ncbi:hypothetical protein P3T73_12090 [Kiritimatiellota bacterium B12222]|nr:hypothetical protein P3T73_12090 [Kiritimatiellota bacterium B12222]
MQKFISLFLILTALPLCASEDLYLVYLGKMDLAGMVPISFPKQGTELIFESVELPLTDLQAVPAGFIPGRFREAIVEMQKKGLQLQFEVDHHYESPLPGKFLSVEVWVQTHDLDLIRPLIYSIPIQASHEIAAFSE